MHNLFGFEHHHCDNPWDQAPPWAVELREMLSLVLYQGQKQMKEYDDLVAAVAAEDSVIDGAVTMIQGIPAMIAAALTAAGATITPAQLTAVNTDIAAKTAQLAAALVTGTPVVLGTGPLINPTAATVEANAAVATVLPVAAAPAAA